MYLNENIKILILNYCTYTDKQINEFTIEWKNKIKEVNKFFKISFIDYNKECYICKNSDHFNFECPKFYYQIHVINKNKD